MDVQARARRQHRERPRTRAAVTRRVPARREARDRPSRASPSTGRCSSGTTSHPTKRPCRSRFGRLRDAACVTRRASASWESSASSASSSSTGAATSFYFLLVCTWRNENELWQTVWAKDGERDHPLPPVGGGRRRTTRRSASGSSAPCRTSGTRGRAISPRSATTWRGTRTCRTASPASSDDQAAGSTRRPCRRSGS